MCYNYTIMTWFKDSVLTRNKNFRIFFIADTVGKIADSYFLLMLPFLFYDFTDSGLAVGIALALNGVFRGVVALYGGVLADRFAPQKILAIHNLLQALTLLGMFLLIRYGVFNTFYVYTISAFFGVLDGFASPASQSATPKIVTDDDLLEANSYTQGLEQLTAIIGPVAAGFIYAYQGVQAAVLGGFLLYVISTIYFGHIYNLNIVQKATLNTKTKLLSQLREGWQVLKTNKIVQASLGLLIINNFFITGPVVVGLLILSRTKFGLSADIYALSGVLFSIGFLAGVPLVQWLARKFNPSKLLLAVYATYGLTIAGMGLVPNFYWIMVLYFIVGPAVAIDLTLTTTWQQTAVPKKLLGRVGSLSAIASLALDPLSQALTGWATDWSIEGTFVVAGVGIFVCFLVLYLNSATVRSIEIPTH